MTQAGPLTVPAPAARSWLPRVGALGLAGVVAAALLGGYGIVLFRLRHSPAGKSAVVQVRGSSQLQALLGQPLHVHIEGGDLQHDGQAAFSMHVRGPRGSAHLELDVRVKQRVWSIVRGTVSREHADDVALDLSALAPPLPPKSPPAVRHAR